MKSMLFRYLVSSILFLLIAPTIYASAMTDQFEILKLNNDKYFTYGSTFLDLNNQASSRTVPNFPTECYEDLGFIVEECQCNLNALQESYCGTDTICEETVETLQECSDSCIDIVGQTNDCQELSYNYFLCVQDYCISGTLQFDNQAVESTYQCLGSCDAQIPTTTITAGNIPGFSQYFGECMEELLGILDGNCPSCSPDITKMFTTECLNNGQCYTQAITLLPQLENCDRIAASEFTSSCQQYASPFVECAAYTLMQPLDFGVEDIQSDIICLQTCIGFTLPALTDCQEEIYYQLQDLCPQCEVEYYAVSECEGDQQCVSEFANFAPCTSECVFATMFDENGNCTELVDNLLECAQPCLQGPADFNNANINNAYNCLQQCYVGTAPPPPDQTIFRTCVDQVLEVIVNYCPQCYNPNLALLFNPDCGNNEACLAQYAILLPQHYTCDEAAKTVWEFNCLTYAEEYIGCAVNIILQPIDFDQEPVQEQYECVQSCAGYDPPSILDCQQIINDLLGGSCPQCDLSQTQTEACGSNSVCQLQMEYFYFGPSAFCSEEAVEYGNGNCETTALIFVECLQAETWDINFEVEAVDEAFYCLGTCELDPQLITSTYEQGSCDESVLPSATLYSQCNFEGESLTICQADYYFNLNWQIYSIEIENGYQLTLYDDMYFEGYGMTYAQSIECFDSPQFLQVSKKSAGIENYLTVNHAQKKI